jgi:hypothetical protein
MSGSFRIKGADGPIAIEYGEYYFNTKARGRRMMQNSLSSEARRVYACLELATMGFQQELAVRMVDGEKQPLTRADISEQTGLSKQNARRGLVELEDEGLAERRPIIAEVPLQKGNVAIYSWATPRPKPEKKRESRATPFPVWFPTSWEPLKPLVKRLRLQLPADLGVARDSLLAEGEEVADDFQKAEMGVRKFLERVCAQTRPNKEERTERTLKENNVPQVSELVLSTLTHSYGQPIPETDKLPRQLAAIAAAVQVDDASLCRWIEAKTAEKRRKRYTIESLGFYVHAAATDLLPWLMQHPELVAQAERASRMNLWKMQETAGREHRAAVEAAGETYNIEAGTWADCTACTASQTVLTVAGIARCYSEECLRWQKRQRA